MAQNGIRAGDVVRLKAGGPAMTVQARSQNLALCAWATEGRAHQGTFEVQGLELVVAAEGGSERAADGPASAF